MKKRVKREKKDLKLISIVQSFWPWCENLKTLKEYQKHLTGTRLSLITEKNFLPHRILLLSSLKLYILPELWNVFFAIIINLFSIRRMCKKYWDFQTNVKCLLLCNYVLLHAVTVGLGWLDMCIATLSKANTKAFYTGCPISTW